VKMHSYLQRSKQQGLTLVTVLIVLVLITLVSITSFKLSSSNLQVVDNMQMRNQTNAAAEAAIENTISQATFITMPNVAVTTYASIGGSTTNDIKVVVTPTCIQIQPIPNASLNLLNSNDVGCMLGVSQQSGVAGTNGPNSMCANSVWNIQAVATDLSTNSTSTIHRGVAVRVPITATCP